MRTLSTITHSSILRQYGANILFIITVLEKGVYTSVAKEIKNMCTNIGCIYVILTSSIDCSTSLTDMND